LQNNQKGTIKNRANPQNVFLFCHCFCP